MELRSIPGIGEVKEKKLNKLEIYSAEDLVSYYPFRYNNIFIEDIDSIKDLEHTTISAMIVSSPRVQYIKRNLNRLTFKAMSKNRILDVTIFNRAFYKNAITLKKEILLIGNYNPLKNTFVASDIRFNILNNTIEPVYHLVDGISSSDISKLISKTLNIVDLNSYIPSTYIDKHNYISKKEAMYNIHFPKNEIDKKSAINRLRYEELFNFLFKINIRKSFNDLSLGIKRNVSIDSINTFESILPFKLTKDQLSTIKSIYEDLTTPKRMNRIVLGDVGSGKTMVATYAIYLNFLSNHQSALMAPTEILAEQHYNGIKKILDIFNINTELLTGKTPLKNKKDILKRLKEGSIDLLIGTHSLISDSVEFNNLGLVVIDEQHRFGVTQRNTLSSKGIMPDALYLSATPIPRTYAMTIYGDLDISIIKIKPNGRKEIITKVIKEKDIKDLLYSILEELKKGHQIYIVSPLIEDNDNLELQSVIKLKERFEDAFKGKVKIDLLHGKLKNTEKERIMNDFKEGITKILISTTVIEVGIDVANATTIVIFNAERFGLATLHQLRGRVGRSDIQSYCYLVCNDEIERLKVLENSNDGFYITEKDLELRGEGKLLGERQSGEGELKIVSLTKDKELVFLVKDDVDNIIKEKTYKNIEYYKNIEEEILNSENSNN